MCVWRCGHKPSRYSAPHCVYVFVLCVIWRVSSCRAYAKSVDCNLSANEIALRCRRRRRRCLACERLNEANKCTYTERLLTRKLVCVCVCSLPYFLPTRRAAADEHTLTITKADIVVHFACGEEAAERHQHTELQLRTTKTTEEKRHSSVCAGVRRSVAVHVGVRP